MANRVSDTEAVIHIWEIWDRQLNDCIPKSSRVTLPLALAEQWLFSYGAAVVEDQLPHAIDLWLRKCAREQLLPDHDLVYLRRYIQRVLRTGKEQQLTKDVTP